MTHWDSYRTGLEVARRLPLCSTADEVANMIDAECFPAEIRLIRRDINRAGSFEGAIREVHWRLFQTITQEDEHGSEEAERMAGI